MTTPFLTDAEVREMAEPLVQPAAIRRWCVAQGIPHKVKPSGMPLISRSALDVLPPRVDQVEEEKPDVSGLLEKFRKGANNGDHGAKAKKQSTRAA